MRQNGLMRFSEDRIKNIQSIMKDQFGKDVTDEEAQQIGLAVLAFVIAKAEHEPIVLNLTEDEING